MNKRSLVAGGLRTNVVEAGSGPDVVLLHGFANLYYMRYFREPGPADRESARDVATTLPAERGAV